MNEMKPECVRYKQGADKEYTYLCACIDHRFFEAVLEEFRKLTGNHYVYLETEMGGAPSFGSTPRSAEVAHNSPSIEARKMGWAAHGGKCAGFPGRTDDEMRAKLLVTARERVRDFPDAKHYMLFAVPDGDDAIVEVTELSRETSE